MSNTVTTQKNTSKKAKALLAGGLVLGVGAVVTFASWTDQEWANASFSSSDFVLESSTNGEDFKSHPGNDAILDFDLDIAKNLAPGQELIAPFALRLSADTGHDAVVTMGAPSDDDYIKGLDYRLAKAGADGQCDPGLEFKPASAAGFKLHAGDGNAAGDAEVLCFHVSASETLEKGKTVNPTWTFTAQLDESTN
ncbi:hypothetical protein GCM10023190_14180 [Enteractinococcus fodinae]|uniref:Ribosomally synthesized peptide with SipW-like signal peptide n=1 Tax=Enteractinococcus fodinae TaxID=684663 RepID=A0ABU2AY76_9MICC|nr:SipW-dependent-type signal peptide-containing protein [Enteractinococcus fodinae]MDR7346106.1 putative ribosomally synthesized peptide with SipW-like signal peptide [Enteractinococcus fodinae]